VYVPILGTFSLANLVILAIGLLIIWIIVTIPVYVAARFVVKDASFRDAMVATIFGPIVYVLTLFAVDYLFGPSIGTQGYTVALILALVAWISVFKASFRTGWLRGLVIALLAILVFAFLSVLFGLFLGVMLQPPFFPTL